MGDVNSSDEFDEFDISEQEFDEMLQDSEPATLFFTKPLVQPFAPVEDLYSLSVTSQPGFREGESFREVTWSSGASTQSPHALLNP